MVAQHRCCSSATVFATHILKTEANSVALNSFSSHDLPEGVSLWSVTFSIMSIGIGRMVGGGIFAVTGLTVEVTKGAAQVAFLIAGILALLTSYSYLELTLKLPGEGGTVAFLNQAFGDGVAAGAASILLLLIYVVLVAVYAYAFVS